MAIKYPSIMPAVREWRPMFLIYTALTTPINKNNSIDFQALEKNLARQMAGERVGGIILCGTTGEFPTITAQEFTDILKFAVSIKRQLKSSIQIIAGCSVLSTQQGIDIANYTYDLGVESIMVCQPPYLITTQEGITKHITTIHDKTSSNILLYNIPKRTGYCIEKSTMIDIADRCDRFLGVKDAGANLINNIYDLKQHNIPIYIGNDDQYLPGIMCGADGMVSVLSNAIPKIISNIIDHNKAINDKFYKIFSDLNNILSEYVNPVGVKICMHALYGDPLAVRMPLVMPADIEKTIKCITNYKDEILFHEEQE